ncbi:hypothetical protein CPB83DRAFT_845189 [Crepidotus variabilis]|uniref:Uncharacterized protein n=1 Tax=Crepidotus variabilis TaxID=179855 RepID=A0A9P6JVF2_9AGAR|nr:hypothetical protein CPB83DRAFT_845189 [Crepidotus variabilis]
MIETGGVERDAWISLHPQWSSVMPSVNLPPTPISTLLRPGDFLVLVKVLQALRLEGNWGPLWSQVAPHITLSGIYEKTGIKTLDDYVKLAVKQGIVDIGGEGGTRWMRLLPDWHLRVTA